MYEIYDRLKTERGLKDSQVAKKAEIAPATLSAWKHEGTPKGYTPKYDKLCKIAKALEVPVSVFYEGVANESNG